MAQVSENHDPETFAEASEASGNPDWDAAMDEEYRSLMANDTCDLVPLPKGRKLVRCNGSTELSMYQMEVLKDLMQG